MYKEIDSNKRKTVLLMGIFLVFIIGLGWIFSYIYQNNWILIIAVLFSITQATISYYYSDKITLSISKAHEAKRNENIILHRLVENLAITAGFPKPKIYIINDSAPNAFATGRDPRHAVICVTTGLLDKLNKTELEGVIAHEMSHIGNYDIRLMTIVVVLVGIIALISDWFLRWGWFSSRSRDSAGNQAQAILMIIGIILAILAPISAYLIQLAISRKREYLADANGALLTRYPEGLASALEKISQDKESLEVANKATAHLYITNPLREGVGSDARKGRNSDSYARRSWWANLFNTHPPIEDRVKRLRTMIGK